MQDGKLPNGWEWKRLGDIFSLSSGKSRPQEIQNSRDPNFNFPIYGGNGILGYSIEFFVENPAIVIGRVGQYCGSIYISESKCWISDNALYATKFFKEIDLNFLKLMLTKLDLNRLKKQFGQPLITQKIVCDQMIPLPSLPTQRKIVAILEQAEATKRLRAESDELTQRFLQSVFMEMFGDPVKNEKGWDVVDIEKIAEYVSYGFTNPMSNRDEGPILLTATNIKNGKIDYETARHTSKIEYDKLTSKSKPKIDDILVTKDGTLGNVAIVDREDICINQSVACIRILKEKIDAIYFSYLLQTSQIQYVIKTGSGGSSIKHIYITKLAKVKIPLPPLALQQEFAQIVGHVETLRERQRQSAGEINLLFEGLMQKAFRGELVA